MYYFIMALETIPTIDSPPPSIKDIDRETAMKKLAFLKQKQQERLLGKVDEEERQRQTEEILELNPQNVLVVCHAGVFRSGMVKEILENRGYEATNTGTMKFDQDIVDSLDDYDAIIFMSKKREEEFKKLYEIEDLKVPVRHIGIAESANLHNQETRPIEIKAAETKLDNMGFITKKEPL